MTSKTGMFDGFDQLDVRMEKEREETHLEVILDLEKKVIQVYEKQAHVEQENLRIGLYGKIRDYVMRELKIKNISGLLINLYIESRDNAQKNNVAFIRGMYAGVLLEKACFQTDEPIVIDGHNKTFHYLFNHARKIRNLTLENISGDEILKYAGSNDGICENVCLRNITGNKIGYGLGAQAGKVKNISAIHIFGKKLFFGLGNSGTAENVIAVNIQGDDTLCLTGSNGRAKNIILYNAKGNNALDYSANKGNIENVIAGKITGNHILGKLCYEGGNAKNIISWDILGDGTFSDAADLRGNIVNLHLEKIQGEDTLFCAARTEGTITNLSIHSVPEMSARLRMDYAKKWTHCKRKSLTKNKYFKKIIELLPQLEYFTSDERIRLHDEIAECQEKVFSKIQK